MRAFYNCIGNLGLMLPVAQLLAEKGVEPVYWSADSCDQAKVKSIFPGVTFQDQRESQLGDLPECLLIQNSWEYVDSDILKSYAEVQRLFIEMILTRTGGGHSWQWYELSDVFHKALSFSLSLVDHLKPDIWISLSPPHYGINYVLYEVCRRAGVKTVMFVHTHLPGKTLAVDSLWYEADALKNKVSNLEASTMPDELRLYIDGVRSSYSEGIPLLIKKNHDADKYAKYSTSNILKRLNAREYKHKKQIKAFRGIKALFSIDDGNQMVHYLKQPKRSWRKSYTSRNEFLRKRIDDISDRKALIRSYDSLSADIDLSKKYIYFPMNMQPECTTVPQAGIFSDQILSLRLLSESLPEEWKIYVKECPAIYDWHRGSFARHATYYEDLKEIDHVMLVPLDSDPFLLIDKSQAVICSTGTAGFESVLRGVPVMMLGDLYWYKGFPGVRDVSSVPEMKAFFEDIKEQSFLPEKELVDLYVHALYEVTYGFCLDKRLQQHFQISNQDNIAQVVQAIWDLTK